jgi:glycosyltransferase involved in cell wall biosynthesis
LRLLYLTAEEWPTFRADVTTLFGKYLPILGIYSDLVTEASHIKPTATSTVWPAGQAIVCEVPAQRAMQYIVKFLHQCKVLICSDYAQYDAVQVRDMTVIALVALVMCKLKKRPFLYWLSYPQSEGQIQRAKARGMRGGMKYWFPLIQGTLGKWLLHQWILPKADYIFVQSDNMRQALAKYHIPLDKMTPVPMGVDMASVTTLPVPHNNPALTNKRVVVYLGTLDKTRQIELLFDMLARIQLEIPNVILVLAGDTEDVAHRAWLKHQAEIAKVADAVLWTGWLAMDEAWRYVISAEVGLSPFPRGLLLDMASPTKAVEYMALGVPVVANDNPDQAQVIAESGAGVCVPLTAEAFARATLSLLNDAASRARMSALGKTYIAEYRSYQHISAMLAERYHTLITTQYGNGLS